MRRTTSQLAALIAGVIIAAGCGGAAHPSAVTSDTGKTQTTNTTQPAETNGSSSIGVEGTTLGSAWTRSVVAFGTKASAATTYGEMTAAYTSEHVHQTGAALVDYLATLPDPNRSVRTFKLHVSKAHYGLEAWYISVLTGRYSIANRDLKIVNANTEAITRMLNSGMVTG